MALPATLSPAPSVSCPQPPSEVDLVRLIGALAGSESLDELEDAFTGVGALLSVPMYGFYVLEPGTDRIEHNVGVNVSDAFVARYEAAMEHDPLIDASRQRGAAAYNLDLMSADEWRQSPIFRHAYSVHSMQHVVEVPIAENGELLGALHMATSEPTRDMTSRDLATAEAVAEILASSISRLRSRKREAAELERALAALETTGTAVAWTGSTPADLRLNRVARELIAGIVDGEQRLYDLLARGPGDRSFARRVRVELLSGEDAVLHAYSSQVRGSEQLVTVLELQVERGAIRQERLAALTPRETEVATLVVEGLTDREIAERLILSRYTISQHVRSIYHKFGLGSRVALTRALIAPPPAARRD
jgi:DNA-binding CsgD family transcriptional regulator